jgi:pimeloyl-ACP methyl ester carboxylesterase
MPTAHVAFGKLFYAQKGEGTPVVFLNGLSGDHGYWMGQLRALARRYRCLAIDNRDVGQSSYASEPYTIGDLAADVAELLDQLHVPQAHIVGLSMGGMIAQELALTRPDLVHSLALVSTLARADDWFRATLQAFGLIRRQVPDTASFFEAILPWWVSYRFVEQPDRVAWLRWLLHQNPHDQRLDGFLRQLQAIGQHDAFDRLPSLRCPVLLLVGEDDNVAPPRYTRQLHEKIAHGRLVIQSEVGHAPPIENPAQFSTILGEFLGSI